MYILGIWDGHDSGAALIEGNKILFAANEERYTKRKLEVSFPFNSIKSAVEHAGIKYSDIEIVAFPTYDFTKTMSRVFPYQKEKYYKLRRRKLAQSGIEGIMYKTRQLQYRLKYLSNMVGVLPFCKEISTFCIKRALAHIGIKPKKIIPVEHHVAHASTAAFCSRMKKSLVVTLDGYGDGLCGSVSTFEGGELKREMSIPARNSIGILYEQVTNLVGMRELEDEGKVMAMSCYSFPFSFKDNKLKDLFEINGTKMYAKYNAVKQYGILEGLSWSTPREQFAYFAQQLLEYVLQEFFTALIEEYGIRNFSLAGGVFSNVKGNMKIRMIKELKDWFVFPHMGDGGIALGSALYANYKENGITNYSFNDVYLGDKFSDEEVTKALKERGMSFEEEKDKAKRAAELIED
ncbi:MAG: carbamoyltransferase N-terminal domain-containing protein, partial [Candidatus Micrarchaeaceae archaeon]